MTMIIINHNPSYWRFNDPVYMTMIIDTMIDTLQANISFIVRINNVSYNLITHNNHL